jgi:integrase/recombinase XerD
MDTQLQTTQDHRGMASQSNRHRALSEEKLNRLRKGKLALSKATIQTYATVVRQFNQHLEDTQSEINGDSVMSFFQALRERDVAPATFNCKRYALLKVLRDQVADGDRLQEIALEKVFENIETYQEDKSIDTSKALSEDDIQRLIDASDTQTALCIEFLFKSGCRVSEMLNIRPKDIQPTGDRVRIRIQGKGNKIRTIEIPSRLHHKIQAEFNGETRLFQGLSRYQCYKHIRKVGEKLGFRIGCHTFRHSRATDLHLKKGVSLKATSRFLGHASVKTTAEMYIHDQIDYNEVFGKDRV